MVIDSGVETALAVEEMTRIDPYRLVITPHAGVCH